MASWVGAIAAAIVTGLCEQVAVAPAIVLAPRNASRAADLASRFPAVRIARSNQQVIDQSSVLLLCLRPQDARSVLAGLAFSRQQPVVSMMAGISIAVLHGLVAPAENMATSACTATIAAHFAYLDAICRWLIAHGVSQSAARRQVAATFAGLAVQLRGTDPDFGELARHHATRGGINEQFLAELQQARVFDTVANGLNGVLERLAQRSAGNL